MRRSLLHCCWPTVTGRSCHCRLVAAMRHLTGALSPCVSHRSGCPDGRSDEVHGVVQARMNGHELDRRLGAAPAALAGHVAHGVAAVVGVQAQRAAAETPPGARSTPAGRWKPSACTGRTGSKACGIMGWGQPQLKLCAAACIDKSC